MPPRDLKWFADEVNRLAATIGAPPGYLPTYGKTEDGARPHIEFDGQRFHYVVIERGQVLEQRSSDDPQPILYRVFEDVTFTMACDHERANRRPDQDPRRQMFDAQVQLMGRLSADWRQRTRTRLEEVVRKNPFVDSPGTSADVAPARPNFQRVVQASAQLVLVVAVINLTLTLFVAANRTNLLSAIVLFLLIPLVNIVIAAITPLLARWVRRAAGGASVLLYVLTNVITPILAIVVDWFCIFATQ